LATAVTSILLEKNFTALAGVCTGHFQGRQDTFESVFSRVYASAFVQVYVASALMEWRHVRERDVARKIFEKGLEVAEYATTPEYILAYAAFLCGA
jgi:hypothetical protein